MSYQCLEDADLETLRSLVGRDHFSTGESNLDLHSKDQSHHPPCRPEVVIWPGNREEVAGILRHAHVRRIPVTAWGSGSSLEGNPIPVQGGVVLDFCRMNRILDIRDGDFQVDLEPGVIYQDLNEKLRHRGLFFPPDPGARATIGGMIANNASGTRTVRYGSTKRYVQRLTVVLAGGEVIQVGTRASKSSSGYDLIPLFVGSEGTLGLVVEATLRLAGLAEEFSAAVATFNTLENAGRVVFAMIRAGLDPSSLELMGPECIRLMNRHKRLGLPELPTLFVEFHGPSKSQLAEVLEMAREICESEQCRGFRAGLGRTERDRLFSARHELGEMIIRSHPGSGVLSLDVAVPISAFPDIIRAALAGAEKAGVPGYTFSHAGDGNVHLVLVGTKQDPQVWARIEEVSQSLVERALGVGGTATGEHGVGIGKRRYMEAEHGAALGWMMSVKRLFDPRGILNPGKMFPPTTHEED